MTQRNKKQADFLIQVLRQFSVRGHYTGHCRFLSREPGKIEYSVSCQILETGVNLKENRDGYTKSS
jgi:hypothetical protein